MYCVCVECLVSTTNNVYRKFVVLWKKNIVHKAISNNSILILEETNAMFCHVLLLRGLFDVYKTQRKVFQMFKVFWNVRKQCTISWRRSVSVYLAAKETVWGLWLTPMTSSSSDIGLRRIAWTKILSKNLNSPDNTCMYWS